MHSCFPVSLPADLFKPDDLEVCAPLSENSSIIILEYIKKISEDVKAYILVSSSLTVSSAFSVIW